MSTGLTDEATMPDLTMYGAPNVYAGGDVANIPGPDGHYLPQRGAAIGWDRFSSTRRPMMLDRSDAARIDWEEDRVSESAVA